MNRTASLGVLTLTAVMSSAAPASAQEAPAPLPPPASSGGATTSPSATATVDTVHLRNGGLYRGRVTEIVPGDHLTIVVVEGETKRVPWAEVDRVIVASTALPAPPSPGAPAPVAPTTAGPRARVHITSPRTVILYRRPAGSTSWVQACTSPCDQELPIGDTYRVTGNGVSASKELRLDANPGDTVDLSVDPQSTGGMVLGGILAGGGATAAYVGALVALVGAADASSCRAGMYRSCSDGEDTQSAGLITLAVGAAATVGGILIFLSSAKTDISQTSGAPSSSPSLDAFLRRPMWRRASSSSERATATPPMTFPLLLQGTF